MKKKRFQKPSPPAGPSAPTPPAEKIQAGATAPSSGTGEKEKGGKGERGQLSLPVSSIPSVPMATAPTVTADEAAEPTAAKRSFPVLLFALLGLLIYWADIFLMDHSGQFDAKVYSPYVSTNQLDSFLPKDESQIFRAKGQRIFKNVCAPCHLDSGTGSPGQNPPLAGSDWVMTEGPNRIIRLVLDGGLPPFVVNGAPYYGAMVPQRASLMDDDIAAVLTYVRSEWGNKAPPVTPAQVHKIREATKDRTISWTMDELKAIPDKD